MWLQTAKLIGADGSAGDRFGNSIAINGNRMIVGAWFHDHLGTTSGGAYVFERSGATWNQVAELLPNDPAAVDRFGEEVAIDDTVVVVASPFDDDNGRSSGSIYVFEGTGENWQEVAKLVPHDGTINDWFGQNIVVSENEILVASRGDDVHGSESGSVHRFEKIADGWNEVSKLTPYDGAPEDVFGAAVAISNDWLVIGASNDDDNGVDSGSAYVYQWTGSSWGESIKLTPDDPDQVDVFGASVAISGNHLIVGAPYADSPEVDSGAAYIFERNGSTWNEVVKLNGTDTGAGDRFGSDVDIQGDWAVVGAARHDEDSGAAYIFNLSGASWMQMAKLSADNGASGDFFGDEVAISGNELFVGASGDDEHGRGAGAVYVFEFESSMPEPSTLVSALVALAISAALARAPRSQGSSFVEISHRARIGRNAWLFVAIGVTSTSSDTFGFGLWAPELGLAHAARWDAAPRIYADPSPGAILPPVERSLDGGLRYSLSGQSFAEFHESFSWRSSAPPLDLFRQTVQEAFDAWSAVDPASGLHSTLSFIPDLEPVPQNGFNVGAEIDVMAVDFGGSGLTASASIVWGPVQDVLLTSGVTIQAAPILGADIRLNKNGGARYSLDWFRLILTHEIGHALGLQDVDWNSGPNGEFIDDNYDPTSSSTIRSTLTNSFADSINPLDPGSSTLFYFTIADADPGIDTAGVNILMESSPIPRALLGDRTPLTNDDFAGRQFLYPVVTLPAPGDYNLDGTVNAADYTVWRNTLGSTTDLVADGDGNGTIDPADYDVWKMNFGNTASSGSSSNAAVPEPGSRILLIGLTAAVMISRSLRIRLFAPSVNLTFVFSDKWKVWKYCGIGEITDNDSTIRLME